MTGHLGIPVLAELPPDAATQVPTTTPHGAELSVPTEP